MEKPAAACVKKKESAILIYVDRCCKIVSLAHS